MHSRITIDMLRGTKVKLDNHKVTIKSLRSDLAKQRDLVKELREIIGEFRDTNRQLQDEVKDYKENINDTVKVMNRLRRHILSGVATGQHKLDD